MVVGHVLIECTFRQGIDYVDENETVMTATDEPRWQARITLAHRVFKGGLKEKFVPVLKDAGPQHIHDGFRARFNGEFTQGIDPRPVEVRAISLVQVGVTGGAFALHQ